MPRAPSIGFFTGLRSLFRGFSFIAKNPTTWPFALVPGIVWLAIVTLAAYLSISWLGPWVRSLLPTATSAFGRALSAVAGWLTTAIGVVVGALLAGALAPPLSAPALEKIVDQVETPFGLPPRPSQGFVAEIVCGLRAQALGFSIGAPLLLTLWFVGIVFPPSQPVLLPLQYVVASFAIAWNLFDYPLTLRGVPARERLRLIASYWTAALGFGLGFAALFAVPCAAILLLPSAVAGATDLVGTIQRARAARPEP